jgi:hypothetical protein
MTDPLALGVSLLSDTLGVVEFPVVNPGSYYIECKLLSQSPRSLTLCYSTQLIRHLGASRAVISSLKSKHDVK